MKTKLFFSVVFLFTFCLVKAQVVTPQGISYQAVVRDGSGAILANENIVLLLSVLDGLEAVQWKESHSVTTNAFGLVSVVLGEGTYVSGTQTVFSDIDWGADSYSLKTEVEYESETINLGTNSILAVPYALEAGHARSADAFSGEVVLENFSIVGNPLNPEESLFEVKNSAGQTIFAVYDGGVQIYVSNSDVKGIKGGFAVTGFGDAKAETNLLVVSPDSTRVYVGANASKGIKGGFAVTGFGDAKGEETDLLLINTDSTRVYIGANADKGIKGGFAVGSFEQMGKGWNGQEYFRVTRDSTRIYLTTDTLGNVKGGFSVETQIKDATTGLTTSTEFFSVATDTSKTTSIGYETKALGKFSTALGYGTVAKQPYETVAGMYNDTTNYYLDRLFTVGVGYNDKNRENAFTILKNGSVGIGVLSPSNLSMLLETDTTNRTTIIESRSVIITGPDNEFFEMPNKGTTYLTVDGSIDAKNLYLDYLYDSFYGYYEYPQIYMDGGSIYTNNLSLDSYYDYNSMTTVPPYLSVSGGTVSASVMESDTITTQVNVINGTSLRMADMNLVDGGENYWSIGSAMYSMMSSGASGWEVVWANDPTNPQYGMFAQELQSEYPNAVKTVDGVLMVDYEQLVPILWQAIIELANYVGYGVK
jgi:hypothetical protein